MLYILIITFYVTGGYGDGIGAVVWPGTFPSVEACDAKAKAKEVERDHHTQREDKHRGGARVEWACVLQ